MQINKSDFPSISELNLHYPSILQMKKDRKIKKKSMSLKIAVPNFGLNDGELDESLIINR